VIVTASGRSVVGSGSCIATGPYRHPGGLDPWVAGVVGSLITVWVTFVPCFLFVFLGAPSIERLRHNRALSAALTGVTAAVVGGDRQSRALLRPAHPVHHHPPHDWAAPVLVFVALSVYADLRAPADRRRYRQVRALCTLAALAVNVLTI